MNFMQDIRSCLETHLDSTVGLPEISWDNVAFNPVENTPFIRAMFIPTSLRPEMRGYNPTQRYQGLFTLQVHAPENQGTKDSNDLVEILLDRFKATTDLSFTNPITSQTVYVGIEYAEPTLQIAEPPWFISPINIAWFSYNR